MHAALCIYTNYYTTLRAPYDHAWRVHMLHDIQVTQIYQILAYIRCCCKGWFIPFL